MFNTTVNPSNNLSGWFENSIYNLIYDNRLNEKLPRDLELVTLGNNVMVQDVKNNIADKGYAYLEIPDGIIMARESQESLIITVLAESFGHEGVAIADLRYFNTPTFRKLNIRSRFKLGYGSPVGLFKGAKIDELNIRNFDLEGVTSLNSMFELCNIGKLNIHFSNTESLESLDCMFLKSRIRQLNLDNFDTSNVASMKLIFKQSRIDNLSDELPKLKFDNVKYLNGAFSWLDTPYINIDKPEASELVDISTMFAYSKIRYLRLHLGRLRNVNNIAGIFNYTDSEIVNIVDTDVIVEHPVDLHCDSGTGLFCNCKISMLYLGSSLEQVLGTIHKVQLEKGLIGEIFSSYIEEGESCFDDTDTTIWLEHGIDVFMSSETADKPDISLNEGTREIDESLAIAISSLADNAEVEGGIISVEYIADINYRDTADKAKCLGLNHVDLPDASIVRMSNNTICVLAKAFSYSAHQVSVPCIFETLEFNTIKFKNVKLGSDLTGLFKCLKCRTLDLSGLDLSETTNTSQMFSKAYIDKVIFGDNTTAKVNIMRGMFEEAHIGEIDFNAIKFDSASDIEDIFNGFTGALIDGIKLTVNNISSVQSIFEDTVVGKLTLNIPYGSKCRSLKRMFKNCNIKEIEIGELVGALINDVTSTFEDCQIGKLKIGTLGLWRIANMYEMFNGITVDKNSIEVPKKIEYFIRASMEPMDNIKIKADYSLGGAFLA